ncbi:MAG: peptidylprolyl isomerase [Candidatus Sericytochromatia bacterium]|nr:peptidylprolyl isomerase [Candidatus Sericytochromatia bacterium]
MTESAKPTGKAISGLIAAIAVAGIVGAGTYYYTSTRAYVATVNGSVLSMKDFQHRLEGVKKQYAQQMGVNFQNEAGKAVLVDLREKIILRMVETELIRNETHKLQIEPDAKTLAKEFDSIVQSNFGGDKTKLKERLVQMNLTEAEVREQIADGQRVQRLMDKLAGSDVVTEPVAAAYYKDHANEFQKDFEVQASHILVPSQEEANRIKAELDKGGDFAALAKQYSKDPGSGAKGGDLGFFGKGKMVPIFEQTAFNAKVGVVSAPVKSQFGYHLIKVTDRHEAGMQPFEAMKKQVIDQLNKEKRQTAFTKWMAGTKQTASVHYATGYEPKKPLVAPAVAPKVGGASDAGAAPASNAAATPVH